MEDQTSDATDDERLAEGKPPLPWPQLTNRERETADCLVRGMTNREIAHVLGISIKTVDTFRGHVLKKIGVRNNVELTHVALFKGYATVTSLEPHPRVEGKKGVTCERCGHIVRGAHPCTYRG